jgi:hypothetical protein
LAEFGQGAVGKLPRSPALGLVSIFGLVVLGVVDKTVEAGLVVREKDSTFRLHTVLLTVRLTADVMSRRSPTGVIIGRAELERLSIELLGAQFPVAKRIRLLGVSLSTFASADLPDSEQLPLGL